VSSEQSSSLLTQLCWRIKRETMRRFNLSLATFVLICFFLPWVQLSCLNLRESASGYDLARSGSRLLWLVPLIMLAILILGLSRFAHRRAAGIYALVNTAGGSICAYLMYREHSHTEKAELLVAAQWTATFWLSFIACILVVITGFMSYSRAPRSP